MMGLAFSSKLDWDSYIMSIAKTASQKIGALICSMKFLSSEVAPQKSNIWPCIKYCCHVWAGAPNCHLELLDKLQKEIFRTVGPSLAASLEPMAHLPNVACIVLFYIWAKPPVFVWCHFHNVPPKPNFQLRRAGSSFSLEFLFIGSVLLAL